MNKMSNEETIAWLEEIFEVAPGSLSPTISRDQIPNWDSIGTLSLIAELDEKLGIRPVEDELDSLTSVGAIIAFLNRNDAIAE